MDLFRKIFGFHYDDHQNPNRRYPEMNPNDVDRYVYDDDQLRRRSFDVFSDPIQMHQYFEQQMNDVLKMFGFNGTHEFSIGFPNSLDNWSQTETRPEDHTNNYNPNNLRDQFLKPGYEKPKNNHSEKMDKDLDDKIKSGGITSVLGETYKPRVTPYEAPPGGFFYGTSQSVKTVTNADGSIETHRTTRDNEGNVETSECHKIGDKEYCIIKKKDKYGKEEVTENFVNMNENEKNIFLQPKQPRINDGNNTENFPWIKFF